MPSILQILNPGSIFITSRIKTRRWEGGYLCQDKKFPDGVEVGDISVLWTLDNTILL